MRRWLRSSHRVLGREFLGIMGLFVPLMVAADIILTSPDGAHGFALSVFGFSDRARKNWKARLEERAVEAVRRAFMFDLKNKRKPIQTIERLSFGDEALMASAKGMLDLLSGDFDNIKDREGAVEVLAPAYADSREPALRATEIGRRYRSLMRALHPDSLAHILPADVLQTAPGKAGDDPESDHHRNGVPAVSAAAPCGVRNDRSDDRERDGLLRVDSGHTPLLHSRSSRCAVESACTFRAREASPVLLYSITGESGRGNDYGDSGCYQ